ncbi:MAG: hemolysin III family protein [Clostridiales bacterium]|nr:hemolysin III family protein [Clostridiales bacterium]
MSNNKKYWKSFMANDGDRKAAKEGTDPLEKGLEGISWLENSRRVVKNAVRKTQETFGEEVGNSITSGILAFFVLGLIPFASVNAYVNAPHCKRILDAFGVSVFLVTMFMAALFTTIFHFLKHGSLHKEVFRKLDHIMVYFAIFGVYTPVCLSLVGGGLGLGILIAEGCLAVFGTILMALTYPKHKIAVSIYGVMGVLFLFMLKPFYRAATTACFWLLFAGLCVYIVGLFFYSGKKFKFSHMVWHLLVLCASVCHILALVYFFR